MILNSSTQSDKKAAIVKEIQSDTENFSAEILLQ